MKKYLILPLILLISVGCSYVDKDMAYQSQFDMSESGTKVSSDVPSDWSLYDAKYFGFTINYPSDWTVYEDQLEGLINPNFVSPNNRGSFTLVSYESSRNANPETYLKSKYILSAPLFSEYLNTPHLVKNAYSTEVNDMSVYIIKTNFKDRPEDYNPVKNIETNELEWPENTSYIEASFKCNDLVCVISGRTNYIEIEEVVNQVINSLSFK